MGFLKTEEEKAAKAEEKIEKLMRKYHLEDVSPKYAPQVKEIALELSGNKMIELGTLLQGNAVESTKLSYLSAIMRQNWIIIQLLDEIARK